MLTITDQVTGTTYTATPLYTTADTIAALTPWFPGAPEEITTAIHELAAALGPQTHHREPHAHLSDFLGLTVELG